MMEEDDGEGGWMSQIWLPTQAMREDDEVPGYQPKQEEMMDVYNDTMVSVSISSRIFFF